MAGRTHIDITFDLQLYGGKQYDLRIPVQQPIRQLLQNLMENLGLFEELHAYAIKVVTKQLVLADDDKLSDYPVADGDILLVLASAAVSNALSLEERN